MAQSLLGKHPLRAADALQLAAALLGVAQKPFASTFYVSDARLARAATKEGFIVL